MDKSVSHSGSLSVCDGKSFPYFTGWSWIPGEAAGHNTSAFGRQSGEEGELKLQE